jgi:hypothetical protein
VRRLTTRIKEIGAVICERDTATEAADALVAEWAAALGLESPVPA